MVPIGISNNNPIETSLKLCIYCLKSMHSMMTKNVKNYNAKVLIDDHLILEDPDQAIKEKNFICMFANAHSVCLPLKTRFIDSSSSGK